MATPSGSEPQQSSPALSLTFGHLIENHVDQDVGAAPARAVTVNRRREMRTQRTMLSPLPTRQRWHLASVLKGGP